MPLRARQPGGCACFACTKSSQPSRAKGKEMPILRGTTQAAGQGLGKTASAVFRAVSLAPPASSGMLFSRELASGAKVERKWWSELVTIATAAYSYTTSTMPADCIVLAVMARVTVAVPATTTFVNLEDETDAVLFITNGSFASSAGSTAIGLVGCPKSRF